MQIFRRFNLIGLVVALSGVVMAVPAPAAAVCPSTPADCLATPTPSASPTPSPSATPRPTIMPLATPTPPTETPAPSPSVSSPPAVLGLEKTPTPSAAPARTPQPASLKADPLRALVFSFAGGNDYGMVGLGARQTLALNVLGGLSILVGLVLFLLPGKWFLRTKREVPNANEESAS